MKAYDQKCALLEDVKKPRIIIIGGSNAAFSIQSPLIKDSLNMNVINYSLHAGIGLKYMIDDISLYAKKGDILVFAPEYNHFYGEAYGGGTTLSSIILCCQEGKLFLFGFRQILNLIMDMPFMVKLKLHPWRVQNPERTYSASWFNEYGDVVKHWNFENIHVSPVHIKGVFDSSFADYFINKINHLKEVCQVYIVPPVCIESYYNLNKDKIDKVDLFLKDNGFSFLVPPEQHALPNEDAYDTVYHMNKTGGRKFTLSIIEALKPII